MFAQDHALLEEIYDFLWTQHDMLGEQIRQMDKPVPCSLKEVLGMTDIIECDSPKKSSKEMFTWLNKDFDALISDAQNLYDDADMQNAYGKDASMFSDMMVEVLSNVYPDEAQQYLLNGVYGRDIAKASSSLSDALESTLREVINSQSTQVLKDLGRYTAIINTTVMMPGITGDTYVFTPVEIIPVNKANDSGEILPIKLADGTEVMVKYKAYESDTFTTSQGEEVTIESSQMGYSPAATKDLQLIYNQRTKKYDYFNNAIGTSQSRQMAVMPIQSIDGDLVKSTTLFVNKDRSTPVPVMWVHDSSISTPGGSLVYRNAYNNISIPKAIPQIAKFGQAFAKVVKDGEQAEFDRVKAMGRPVGIGSKGDYPALGAYLDEQYERIQDNNSYKQIFLSRAHNNETKWLKMQQRVNAQLKEAEEAGWKAPGSIANTPNMSGEHIRQHLAVTPKQFEKLALISKEMLKLSGPSNRFDSWVRNFSKNVNDTASQLMTASKKEGIGQMTYGATGSRGNITKAKSIAEASDIKRAENFATKYEKAYRD